jgi:dinuclear metal center YbgI/SA1388 family protein
MTDHSSPPFMNTADFIAAIETFAPPSYAAEWDNVGLLAGSRDAPARRAMLTIDLTPAVLREAIDAEADFIMSYHPPIFSAIKSVTDSDPQGRVVFDAIRAGVSIYSPHTALDAAPGGVNDWLCEGLGHGDLRALEPFAHVPGTEQTKIITYCPAEAVGPIRNGLASAGAGRIGGYQLCSFEIPGTGTFLGGEGTNPAIGKRGELNRVNEIRLEMVCPTAALALAVTALRQFHPYEEPPFEIIRFEKRPRRNVGQGRRLVLDQAASLRTLVERFKDHLGMKQVHVAAAGESGLQAKITHIGVCAGAGGSLLSSAMSQDCRLFVTGEMRHHDALHAVANGCSVMLAGHTNTERPYLKTLAKRLREALPEADVLVSKRDSDPLRAM